MAELLNACKTGTPNVQKPEAQKKDNKKVYPRRGNTSTNTKASTSTDNGLTNDNNTVKMISKIIIKGLTMYLNSKNIKEMIVELINDVFDILQ